MMKPQNSATITDKGEDSMIKTVYAYIDGKRLCDVVDEALRLNVMATDLKKQIRKEYEGHCVEFKVEEIEGRK